MKKRSIVFLCVIAMMLMIALSGCGGEASYKAGTYTGQSSGDEDGDYTTVTITIDDEGKITDAEVKTFEKGGVEKIKDEYGKKDGKVANADYYQKAQTAIAANPVYAEGLVETQDAAQVDAVSGASITYEQFQEATAIALDKAKE